MKRPRRHPGTILSRCWAGYFSPHDPQVCEPLLERDGFAEASWRAQRRDVRVVCQWDKDDCASFDLIKIDLLGLGMLKAMKNTLELIPAHYNEKVDIAHLP